MSSFLIYPVGVVKITKGGKDIYSDCLNWVGIGFLLCGGVS